MDMSGLDPKEYLNLDITAKKVVQKKRIFALRDRRPSLRR